MAKAKPIAVLIMVLFIQQVSAADNGYRSTGLSFWKAVATGDLKTLYHTYSDIVLVADGSELLERKWRVETGDDRYETQIVYRDKLLLGLQKLIKSVGREKWQKKYSRITGKDISFRYVSRKHKPYLGNRPGDILMVIDTGYRSPSLVYVLRKVFNRWHVVMEHTRY